MMYSNIAPIICSHRSDANGCNNGLHTLGFHRGSLPITYAPNTHLHPEGSNATTQTNIILCNYTFGNYSHITTLIFPAITLMAHFRCNGLPCSI
ncbi:hypothetical protein Patl1_10359 [Pistacia atlantica]|uniref:Uncharacterized protein n=1 Tax=Pistacia atlantica TaxID=434234 RepID=A0ACC1A6J0_9ROSI|nr:hypothetical protein Patl1_10359 [Pistacia atlantica]